MLILVVFGARYSRPGYSPSCVRRRAHPPPAQPGAAGGDFPGRCPTSFGTLHISECASFSAGYLFYDRAGSGVIDDGGVAYLPRGAPQHDVGNGGFESPQFQHLIGPWYGFASSW